MAGALRDSTLQELDGDTSDEAAVEESSSAIVPYKVPFR